MNRRPQQKRRPPTKAEAAAALHALDLLFGQEAAELKRRPKVQAQAAYKSAKLECAAAVRALANHEAGAEGRAERALRELNAARERLRQLKARAR